jgi:hypothetical protein
VFLSPATNFTDRHSALYLTQGVDDPLFFQFFMVFILSPRTAKRSLFLVSTAAVFRGDVITESSPSLVRPCSHRSPAPLECPRTA